MFGKDSKIFFGYSLRKFTENISIYIYARNITGETINQLLQMREKTLQDSLT